MSVVPGRMGLLITAYLVLTNMGNSAKPFEQQVNFLGRYYGRSFKRFNLGFHGNRCLALRLQTPGGIGAL